MKPSIGRIVHYVETGRFSPEWHVAAIITHVWNDSVVDLELFRPGAAQNEVEGPKRLTSVIYQSPDFPWVGHSWHEPERVEE